MRLLFRAARVIFIIIIPVMLLTGSIAAAANCGLFYSYGFEKYGVAETTGLAPAELEKAARGLTGYFNSNEEYIDITVTKEGQAFTLFNQREVGHLADVKRLFRFDYALFFGAGAYFIAFIALCFWRRRGRGLPGALSRGGLLTLGLMVLLGLGIVLDFERLFWQFHLISFANDLWQLDPARDYLIMLFPQGFWFDAAALVATMTATGALILVVAGKVAARYRREVV